MSKHWNPEPITSSKVAALRKRDGDLCWLCNKHMDFAAKPNSSKAWSLEHLIPSCRDGPDSLENLVLCHPPCNRVLRDRPLKEKIKLRERRQRKLWAASLGGGKKDAVVTPIFPRERRLKGLDEFQPPEFVGRMARVQRRRKLGWYVMLVGAVGLGAGIGLFLI
jgi:hypothetical protein